MSGSTAPSIKSIFLTSWPLHEGMEQHHLKAKITDDSLNNSEHIRMCTVSQYF